MKTMEDASQLISSVDAKLGELFDSFERAVVRLIEEMPSVRGLSGSKNVYGEEQKRLDLTANNTLISALESSGVVSYVATEELSHPKKLGEEGFAVVMDPLDGSSNIDTNNLMGTIVGVYPHLTFPLMPQQQVCAFYVLYGPTTTMVLAAKGKLYEFVLGRRGEFKDRFFLVEEGLTIKDEGGVYGVGAAKNKWVSPVRVFVEELENSGLKLRYGGAFVGDYNQVLHYGGFFSYPATVDNPQGKLRSLYEAGPIALITTVAKGYASDGHQSLMTKPIHRHDERTPVYVGSSTLVKRLEERIRVD
jgi:fructose-1,6-bisphosphatase I